MLYHHSRLEKFRDPRGAVECGTDITLRLRTDDAAQSAELLVVNGEGTDSLLMKAREEGEGFLLWETSLQTPVKPGLLYYCFRVQYDSGSRYYCAAQDQLGGDGRECENESDYWQITVHEKQRVPEWMRNGICYQIFPDRFFCAHPETVRQRMHQGSLLHADWSDDPVYIRDEKGLVTHWDFFGGDLDGITEKLDELRKMQVTVLYLNPIFLSLSNHRYDTADYRQVDPLLGGEEALRKLCREADKRGMHVLLDGVFSHTGSDSLYFNRKGRFASLGAYQSEDSPYYEWYDFEEYPDQYSCWWGVETMPDVRELTPSYLSYQLWDADSTVRRWMRCGISGWRLDVADELPDEFLVQLRQVVLEENPDAILLGEVWEDASSKISYGTRREYLLGRELDSVTDYPFRDAALDFLVGKSDAVTLGRQLESLKENYPTEIFYSLMNMTSTHDTARLATILGGISSHMPKTEAEKQNVWLNEEKKALSRRRLALYAMLMFTHPGMPTVYYGDEIGMEGLEDPWNRRTYPWNHGENEIEELFRKLAEIRMRYLALRTGSWSTLNANHVYAARRWDEENSFVTLLHAGDSRTIAQFPGDGRMTDVLSGEEFVSEFGFFSIPMEGISGRILRQIPR